MPWCRPSTSNSLNELSTIARNKYLNALTVAGATATVATNVTVNGSNAVRYADNTFAATNFTPVNGNNTYTAIAKDSLGRISTNSISVFLPASASYTYDLNGNLLSDGTRYFSYDDENQLISVTVSNAWQSQFVYDGKLRRRITKEFTWRSSSWVQTNEIHYIYDGAVAVQERDINNLPVTTYTRGRDLSGSLQGAGGIGGLLAMSQPSVVNPQHYYYQADGNGNIATLVNAQQLIVAKYLYDAFGNILNFKGALAAVNPYYFASKEYHQNSGLYYIGRRFYDSNLQRWVNRDPIQESGGLNLYAYVYNNAVNNIDPSGLEETPQTLSWYQTQALQAFINQLSGGSTSSQQFIQPVQLNLQAAQSGYLSLTQPEVASTSWQQFIQPDPYGYLSSGPGQQAIKSFGLNSLGKYGYPICSPYINALTDGILNRDPSSIFEGTLLLAAAGGTELGLNGTVGGSVPIGSISLWNSGIILSGSAALNVTPSTGAINGSLGWEATYNMNSAAFIQAGVSLGGTSGWQGQNNTFLPKWNVGFGVKY